MALLSKRHLLLVRMPSLMKVIACKTPFANFAKFLKPSRDRIYTMEKSNDLLHKSRKSICFFMATFSAITIELRYNITLLAVKVCVIPCECGEKIAQSGALLMLSIE